MKFSDIKQLTKSPTYQIYVSWDDLQRHLNRWNEDGQLNLDPEFQRGHVWTEEQQVKYVEFILAGGKSSRELQFNCATWMKKFNTQIYLVDGKQRLNAVMRFLNNEIRAYGHFRNEFEDRLPYEAGFLISMNDLPTYADVLNWYLELNSGGTPHTQEELDLVKKLLEELA